MTSSPINLLPSSYKDWNSWELENLVLAEILVTLLRRTKMSSSRLGCVAMLGYKYCGFLQWFSLLRRTSSCSQWQNWLPAYLSIYQNSMIVYSQTALIIGDGVNLHSLTHPQKYIVFSQVLHHFCPQSKNAVSTNIKHSRYIHLMSNFLSINFHTKRLYIHISDDVDTPFSYGRGLIIRLSFLEFSKTKESTPHMIWSVDTAFLLCGANLLFCIKVVEQADVIKNINGHVVSTAIGIILQNNCFCFLISVLIL